MEKGCGNWSDIMKPGSISRAKVKQENKNVLYYIPLSARSSPPIPTSSTVALRR